MSGSTEPTTSELRAKIVPPAQRQTALPPSELLHSGNAGLVVSKVGQVRSEFRNEARVFAREMAKHVNTRQAGHATAFVYEETFGTEDRLHFLIHLRSFETYYRMVEMGDQDRAYRESLIGDRVQTDDGAKAWDRLFVDGSLRSTVVLPHSWNGDPHPLAQAQTGQADAEILHSGNAGIVIHRVVQASYGARPQALRYAKELADTVNKQLAGEATVFLYEEAFGATNRLHWLLHLKDLTCYARLLELSQVSDGAAQALLGEVPAPAPAGGPAGLFVEGSMSDVALTPHHWGLYGTKEA